MSEWQDSEIGQIPINWKVTSIDDIAEVVTDGAHLSPKLFHGGRYMASVKDMTYDRFDFSDCKTISEVDFEKLQKQGCSPKVGDILISKDGEKCLDLIFVFNQKEKIVLLSSIAIVRLKEGYNPHFYRYFLLSYVAQTIMYKWFRSGSAIPRVVLRDFKKVPVPQTSRIEQDNIASILLNLDKKITLLRQQNKDLGELAQTLFKHWFVEFEFPNKNGEPYLSSGGKMVESEIGEIPEGWKLSTIGENIDTLGGGTPSTKEPLFWENGDVLWYSPTDLTKEKSVFSNGSAKRITQLGLQKSSAKLFPAYSLLMTSRATVGEITINTHEACTNQGFITLIPNEKLSLYFLYDWLKTKLRTVHSLASGSTFPEISKTDFRNMEVLMATEEVQKRFDITAKPIFKSIENNTNEIQTLTQLRDTLLPKLMSGELRVNN
jgi:type I restriction enzyme S subunit